MEVGDDKSSGRWSQFKLYGYGVRATQVGCTSKNLARTDRITRNNVLKLKRMEVHKGGRDKIHEMIKTRTYSLIFYNPTLIPAAPALQAFSPLKLTASVSRLSDGFRPVKQRVDG
jgi:hypothetical protein